MTTPRPLTLAVPDDDAATSHYLLRGLAVALLFELPILAAAALAVWWIVAR